MHGTMSLKKQAFVGLYSKKIKKFKELGSHTAGITSYARNGLHLNTHLRFLRLLCS